MCPDTLENAFATASSPEKVFVGLVQQNCDQKQHDAYGCKTAVMPSGHAGPRHGRGRRLRAGVLCS